MPATVLNYDEAPYDKIRRVGLANDYVYRESQGSIQGRGKASTLIVPGIDVGIENSPGEAQSSRENVKNAVIQAFEAGVDGVILSRKYSEMRLDWLSGAGDAIESLPLA